MTINFDEIIDRRGTDCAKWDLMHSKYGVDPDTGISMWVADMDFRPPQAVQDTLLRMVDHGIYGYSYDPGVFSNAVVNWMQTRHGWTVDPDWMMTTHGLLSGVGIAIQAFSEPGDGVIIFTPVYHVFHSLIRTNGRKVVQSEMRQVDGRYEMDLETLATQMNGSERIVLLCSPHNPGGRVWSREELRAVAEFCKAHDLILISDEIHHDLVMPGNKHTIMSLAAPDHADRIVVCAAPTKTFNIAGAMTGMTIIEDPALRETFKHLYASVTPSENGIGVRMSKAAYSGGAEWLDALLVYLDENRRIFDAGVNQIPGVQAMKLQATYLSWVDFSGTGMSAAELSERAGNVAGIAANQGPTFGKGGETWLRFNFATRRALVEEAVQRLQSAFGDLQ